MEPEQTKIFVGGISWETTEEGLRKYFEAFGDVLEAMIIKDRSTGRSRGFGFVIFSDSAVADKVIQEKHTIDGKVVEAKKAVPRDGQISTTRTNSGGMGLGLQPKANKVFVGGLGSTVNQSDFRDYFEQFGTIVDAVVMYDPTTQRPRGFGFATYELEDAVDKVTKKTFHDLRGKLVEVKKAIPKEPSTAAPQNNASGLSMAMGRGGNFGCGFGQGCISHPQGNCGGRLSMIGTPAPGGTGVFLPFKEDKYCSSGCRIGGGYRPNLDGSYGSGGFGSNPVYTGLSGCSGINVGNGGFVVPPMTRNMWSNGGIGYGVTGISPGYGDLGHLEMPSFSGFQTQGKTQTFARQAIFGNPYSSVNNGLGATDSSYSSLGGGYTEQSSQYGVGVASYSSATREVDSTSGFKDLKLKLNALEPRPLTTGYGLKSTVADGLASYGGHHRLTGRQTGTGVAV